MILILKLDNYSSARANDLKFSNSNESLLRNIRRVFSRFWKCYFLRKGFKEKKVGFLIAVVAALYPILSYLKYKEKKMTKILFIDNGIEFDSKHLEKNHMVVLRLRLFHW